MCLFRDVAQIMMKEVLTFIPSDLSALILFSVPQNFIYDNEALTYQTTLKQDQRNQRSPGLEVRNSQSTCCCADWLWDMDSAWLFGPPGGPDLVSVSPGLKWTGR